MKLIRIRAVMDLTGLSKAYIYVLSNRGVFPKKVRLTERSSAWVHQEVVDWIKCRIEERDKSNKQESA